MDQNLIDYIKKCREQNISDEQIKNALLNAGWKGENIDEGFKTVVVARPKKKFPKKLIKIGIIVLGVIIIAGAVSAGYALVKQTSSANMFKTMAEKIGEVKTYHYEVNLEFSADASESEVDTTNKMSVNLNGDIDRTNPQDIKTHIILDLDAGPFSFQNAEAKFIDGLIYVKSPEALSLMGANSDIDEFKDQWLEIDLDQLGPLDAIKSETDLNEEQTKQIEELIKSADVLKIEKTLKGEIINNVKTSHYKFSINKENFKKLIIEIIKITGATENQSFGEINIEEEIGKSIDNIKQMDGDLWVGKNDKLPYRGTINVVGLPTTGTMGLNFTIEFNFSDFNKAVNITKPENVKSFNDMMNNSLEEAGVTSRDVRRMSDVRQISLALEMYYSDNSAYPVVAGCTSANWNTMSNALKNAQFMSTVLLDPTNSGNNVYMYASNGKDYVLRFVPEDLNFSPMDIDTDGIVMGCNCNDPAFCMSP